MLHDSIYDIDFSKGQNKKVYLDGKYLVDSTKVRKIPNFLIPNIKAMSEYKKKPDVGDWIFILDKRYDITKKGTFGKVTELKDSDYIVDFTEDIRVRNHTYTIDSENFFIDKNVKIRVIPALPIKEDSADKENLKISDLSIALSLKDYEKSLEILPAHPVFDSILRIRKEAEKSQKFAKDYKDLIKKSL